MQKSLIDLYLSKICNGDRSVMDKLCQQLADRLVYVPLVSPVNSIGSTTKVNVLKISENGESKVPVFTSEKRFKNWCFNFGHSDSSFSLLGGDLCAVLQPGTQILLDSSDPLSIELTSSEVQKIAQSGLIEPEDADPSNQTSELAVTSTSISAEQSKPAIFPTREAIPAHDDTLIRSGVPRSVEATQAVNSQVISPSMPKVANGIVQTGPSPINSTSSSLFPKKSGGIISSVTGLVKSSSSSSNRPVAITSAGPTTEPTILSANPEEKDDRKKKSFLSFLKTGKM